MTVVVANQTRTVYDFEGKVEGICVRDYWGNDGEYCLTCPTGAVCHGPNGRGAEPISLATFWEEQLAPGDAGYDALCPVERKHRPTCPLVVACVPLYSCVGNNTCAEGYTAIRCSECVPLHYYRYVILEFLHLCVVCVGRRYWLRLAPIGSFPVHLHSGDVVSPTHRTVAALTAIASLVPVTRSSSSRCS